MASATDPDRPFWAASPCSELRNLVEDHADQGAYQHLGERDRQFRERPNTSAAFGGGGVLAEREERPSQGDLRFRISPRIPCS